MPSSVKPASCNPTTCHIYSSVGANTAEAAELLCFNGSKGPREYVCIKTRLSEGDADDVVMQELPNCSETFRQRTRRCLADARVAEPRSQRMKRRAKRCGLAKAGTPTRSFRIASAL